MDSFEKIINSGKPVLVDFYAEWCGPCKMMPPVLNDLKMRVGDKATILKVDVDRNAEIAGKLAIRGVPTLILFKNGSPVWRQSGVVQASVLEQIIHQHY